MISVNKQDVEIKGDIMELITDITTMQLALMEHIDTYFPGFDIENLMLSATKTAIKTYHRRDINGKESSS